MDEKKKTPQDFLADLKDRIGNIMAGKRQLSGFGGQVLGQEMWRTEFTGTQYGELRDAVDALENEIQKTEDEKEYDEYDKYDEDEGDVGDTQS